MLRCLISSFHIWSLLLQVNFPQWYPFEGVFGYGATTGPAAAALGKNAAFRWEISVAGA